MVVHAWSIRDPDEEQYDLDKVYEDHPNLFSIRLHFGGVFTGSVPGRMYVKGKVRYVDCLDIDLFSIHELNDIVEDLALNDGRMLYYHYLDPYSDLDFGLNALGNDTDIHNLSKFVNQHKLINVYIEHGLTKINTYVKSPHKPKVIIEEIMDEDPASQVSQVSKNLFLEWNEEHASQVSQVTQVENPLNKLQIRSLAKGKSVLIDEPASQVDDVFDTNVMHNESEGRESEGGETDGSDSEDSEFIVDGNIDINDIDVDMRDFEKHVDITLEYMGPSNSVGEDNTTLDEDDINVVQTEEFQTDDEHDDGTVRKRKTRRVHASEEEGVVRNTFYVGQTFSNSKEVKDLIKKHAVETRRDLKMIKNDKLRVRTVCIGNCPQLTDESGPSVDGNKDKVGEKSTNPQKCPWTLHISKLPNAETWQVKTYINEHHCLKCRSLKVCTSEFLSHEIVEVIQDNPSIPIRALQEQIQRKFELGISKMKAFRAKAKAETLLKGDYSTQYEILRDYSLELLQTNPGSTVKIDVEEEPNPDSVTRQFKRIYICLGPLKQGFKSGLRELLGLDGAFMKGPYPGQILTAVGLDGNNSIYPVAYAIVEAETLSSWTWFLQCLGEDLDLATNSNFTFISDRQKGLIPAIAKVFPCAEHRYCLRHIHENMKLGWKGKAYKELLWRCATSTTVQEFELGMKKMRELNTACADWLVQIPTIHWTRSHFSGRSHCDVLLNNLCEVFNRQLIDGRDKPVIIALEYVREYLMKRIVNVQKVIEKCTGLLTPTATKTLDAIKKEAGQYRVIWNGGSKFQVSGPWMDQCVVDTHEKVCTCRKWELTGIPCKHAVAAIWNMSMNNQDVQMPEYWVDKAYWLETWKKVYTFKVGPINGRHMWPKSDVPTTLIAPKHNKHVGRPKKKRRKGVDEGGSKGGKLTRTNKPVICGKCKGEGHNQRTCKGAGN